MTKTLALLLHVADKFNPAFSHFADQFSHEVLYTKENYKLIYPYWNHDISDMVSVLSRLPEHKAVCEVFAGEGQDCFLLKKLFEDVTFLAVDNLPYFDERPGINYLYADCINKPLPQKQDIIFCSPYTTSHSILRDPNQFLLHLKNMHDSLSEDGRMLVSVSNNGRLGNAIRYHYKMYQAGEAWVHYVAAHDMDDTTGFEQYMEALILTKDPELTPKTEIIRAFYMDDHRSKNWSLDEVKYIAKMAGFHYDAELHYGLRTGFVPFKV